MSFELMANWSFNANVNTRHAFGIFMAYVGALRASRPGAVNLGLGIRSALGQATLSTRNKVVANLE